MRSERWRKALTSILVVGAMGVLCFAFAIVVINAAPRLLVPILGLERRESLESALPPSLAPLTLEAKLLDRVELLLPSRSEPLHLDATMEDVAILGRASMVSMSAYASQARGESTYLLTLSESRLNELLRRGIFSEGLMEGRCRNVTADLQSGGLILYADVHLGLRWQHVGVLLTQEVEGLDLHMKGLVLDETYYALPIERGLTRLLLPVDFYVERMVRDLSVVGPLPDAARVEAIRFYADRLVLLAHRAYQTSPPADTGWQTLGAGLEFREIDVWGDDDNEVIERLRVLRLNPDQVDFRVRYDPVQPRLISEWAEATSDFLVINGGYFAPENEHGKETLGVLISGGQRYGASWGDFAGMFAVTADQVSVRWLRERPYDPAERLSEAVQSFPVLVKPGGEMGFPSDADDGVTARRTVVAQDQAGNILFITAPRGTLSLHALAVFLARSDLDLNVDIALNLDGGASTGLWLNAGGVEVKLDSFTDVPSVITVGWR